MWGETACLQFPDFIHNISTHSPRVGRDPEFMDDAEARLKISTHSPRVGRDFPALSVRSHSADFNPLSPCGERPLSFYYLCYYIKFQPTLPVWGETFLTIFLHMFLSISTHSPRVGRDVNNTTLCSWFFNFNPLSPCGERQYRCKI